MLKAPEWRPSSAVPPGAQACGVSLRKRSARVLRGVGRVHNILSVDVESFRGSPTSHSMVTLLGTWTCQHLSHVRLRDIFLHAD